jgi:type IV pilus assembly protein PilO
MRRSFNLGVAARAKKDPRFVARVVLGTLLFLNLVAVYMVVSPVGGSAEELEAQIASLRESIHRRQTALGTMKTLVAKIEQGRSTGDQFLSQYFMDRRTSSSAILTELDQAAKGAGMRPKERSFAYDPIEGSETMSMMTVIANYEGTYSDLLEFVNKLDKSPRFLILDTLTAAPQVNGPTLNVQIKFNTFVREAPTA